MMKLKFYFSVFLFNLVILSNAVIAQQRLNLTGKLALQGYDAVCYIQNNKAVKGNSQFAATYNGATYYFSSVANKNMFLKSSTSYLPQYGGWCAYGIGINNRLIDVDPTAFKIIDKKLYLFYTDFFKNTLKSWNKNEAECKAKAEINWQKMVK
jgi:YHS domain-containing protein